MRHLINILIFFLCINCLSLTAQNIPDRKADSIQTIDSIQNSNDVVPEDDFSPGLIVFALIGIGYVAICFGAGLLIALMVLLIALALVSFGVLTASVFMGALTRSAKSGFKTFLVLSFAVAGIPLGAAGFYVCNRLVNLEFSTSESLIWGAVCGLIAGVLLGFSLYLILKYLVVYIKQRMKWPDRV